MLEKMRFANIMGNVNDIDRVIKNYVSVYEIQLENALKEIVNIDGLEGCCGDNPYSDYLHRAEKLAESMDMSLTSSWEELNPGQAMKIIDQAEDFSIKRSGDLKCLVEKQRKLKDFLDKIEHFIDMDFDISSLRELKYTAFRFGKMPLINYKQFEAYVYAQEDILFVESMKDSRFVYGMYFVAGFAKDRVDTVLASLNFQRIIVPFELDEDLLFGTPRKVYNLLSDKYESVNAELAGRQAETVLALGINQRDINNAYHTLKSFWSYYDLRKYAAKTHNDYYIFLGWVPESEAAKLEAAMNGDEKVILVFEEAGTGPVRTSPPTKLKNNIFVKPFEFFVKTYGLPKYNEIDPTPFVAITYFTLFGAMFGDLGQGAVLSLIGLLMYKLKGMALGKILGWVGISSMFFGLMYGSVFGMEDILEAIWLSPAHSVNNILIIPVGVGAFLIIVTMILNMLNALRQKDMAKLLFGPNGLSGLVFYAGVISIVISVFTGAYAVSIGLAVVFLGIPVVMIAFKEQIGSYLKNKRIAIESGVAMFVLETVIELFEVMLTYFTNTVSFVRVGAFALSHAGMMSVVLLLSKTPDGYNPVVMVLGNLLVMLMEGLVVGIQVLRIEFYELFSRFYEGGGREFIPTRS